VDIGRRRAGFRWGLTGLTAAFMSGTVILALRTHHPGDLASIPQVTAFALVGFLIVRARPQNSVGWLFCGFAFVVTEILFARNYATYALRTNPSMPGGNLAAWFGVWPIEVVVCLISAALILFPHGSPPTRRWRVVVLALVLESAVQLVLSFGWDVNLTRSFNFPEAAHPLALPGLETARHMYSALQSFSMFWLLIAAASMIRRYRLAGYEERAQLKWVMYSVAALGIAMAIGLNLLDYKSLIFFTLISPLIPIAAGIAILRYRLYDIDRIINRTAVYGLVTGVLIAVYFALVLVIQEVSPLESHSSIAVAGSTLAIAALFRPLRVRVQDLVDRRFNRSRYDAVQTLQEFSAHARNEVDLDALSHALVNVVSRTMHPRTVALWIRSDPSPPPS
jgi:hypothetical protein